MMASLSIIGDIGLACIEFSPLEYLREKILLANLQKVSVGSTGQEAQISCDARVSK